MLLVRFDGRSYRLGEAEVGKADTRPLRKDEQPKAIVLRVQLRFERGADTIAPSP